MNQSILEQLQGREIVSCSIGGANMVPVSLSCATRITIQDLKDFSTFDNNKCGLYEVVVTILKVYYDERNRLWYLGCGWCQKSLLEAPNTQYWCRKCEKFYNEGSNRYAFQMEIVDYSACHDVTVFYDVGEKLLGCKANFLADLCKKENSNVGVLERLRSITYGRYNLFVVVGGKDRSHISRPRHDISVVHYIIDMACFLARESLNRATTSSNLNSQSRFICLIHLLVPSLRATQLVVMVQMQ